MTSAAKQGYETTVRIESLKDGNFRLGFSTKLSHLFSKTKQDTYRVRPGLINTPQYWSVAESQGNLSGGQSPTEEPTF